MDCQSKFIVNADVFPQIQPPAMTEGCPPFGAAQRVDLALAPWRILVVDDDVLIRGITRDMLTFLGHEVDTAPSVARALAHLEQRVYHLVITDFSMPGGNGAVLVRAINRRFPNVHTAMISGHNLTELYEAFDAEERPEVMIAKPFSMLELVGLLHLLQREFLPCARAV